MAYNVGDTIELVRMDDPRPIQAGARGVVNRVSNLPRGEVQLGVSWDSGRTLSVMLPHDEVRLVSAA